ARQSLWEESVMKDHSSYLYPTPIVMAAAIVAMIVVGVALVQMPAVEHQSTDHAVSAWHDAYTAAAADRSWNSMLTVGQAAVRVGQSTGHRAEWTAKARRCYLIALPRAEAHPSLDAVLPLTDPSPD